MYVFFVKNGILHDKQIDLADFIETILKTPKYRVTKCNHTR